MNDLPGRGDVNPYGIPVPNPHEQEGPDEEDVRLSLPDLIPISPEMREMLTSRWSDPVQVKIENGELIFRNITGLV